MKPAKALIELVTPRQRSRANALLLGAAGGEGLELVAGLVAGRLLGREDAVSEQRELRHGLFAAGGAGVARGDDDASAAPVGLQARKWGVAAGLPSS